MSRKRNLHKNLTLAYLAALLLIGAAGAGGLMLADMLGGKADSDVVFHRQLVFETDSTVPVVKLLNEGQMLNLTLNEGPAENVRVDLDLVNRTDSEKVARLTVNSSPGVSQLAIMALGTNNASKLTQKSASSWVMTVGVQSTTTFSQPDLRLEFKAPQRQGRPLVFQATLTDVQSAATVQAAPTSTPQPSSGSITTAQQSSGSGAGETESTTSGYSGYNWDKIKDASPIDASSITLINTAFVPQVWRVKAGTKVTFQNRDSVVHQIAVEGHDIIETMNGGDTLTTTFNKPGKFQVVCQIHPPGMFGRIEVTE